MVYSSSNSLALSFACNKSANLSPYSTDDKTPYFVRVTEPYIQVLEGESVTLQATAFGAPTPWVTITSVE